MPPILVHTIRVINKGVVMQRAVMYLKGPSIS